MRDTRIHISKKSTMVCPNKNNIFLLSSYHHGFIYSWGLKGENSTGARKGYNPKNGSASPSLPLPHSEGHHRGLWASLGLLEAKLQLPRWALLATWLLSPE